MARLLCALLWNSPKYAKMAPDEAEMLFMINQANLLPLLSSHKIGIIINSVNLIAKQRSQ